MSNSNSTDHYRQFYSHKVSAAQRGIKFDLTYEQWLAIWGDKIVDRGVCADQFGMLRTRDEGGYELGNVRIGSPKENAQDRSVARRVKAVPGAWVAREQNNPVNPLRTSWIKSRNYVFDEYVEKDDEWD